MHSRTKLHGMHVVVWKLRARPGREVEFESTYGDGGEWSQLFRRGDGYLGTELMRGTDGTYLTIDRWSTESAYRAFKTHEAERYAALDARCEQLTIEETMLCEVEA
jgi:heme-degrading monooxygenase HmoA